MFPVVDPCAFPGQRDISAGESSDEDVDGLKGAGSDGSDVAELGHVGPVAREDGAAEGIDFDLPGAAEAGGVEAEVEPADPGEE